jgi:D-alanyl-D-alanine carboxypeptidase
MQKYFVSTIALILLLFWPTLAQDVSPQPQVAPERVRSAAEAVYLRDLVHNGRDLANQGFYIESLDGGMILADHQSRVAFNPASVIKIATSFAALEKLGANYHFETAFEASGTINKKTRTLTGDLVLQATGDPVMTTADLNRLVQQVIKAGVARVTGSLIVDGPFTYASWENTALATKKLEALLRKQGVRVTKAAKRGKGSGTLLASRLSPSLRDIVFEQNAHSVNRTAERLGEAIGGTGVIQSFLVRSVGISTGDVFVGRASGLGHNRITPQATVKLLRHMVLWLNFNNLLPEDVLPVAGLDPGTLRARFRGYSGSVIGKTGTLPATEGGVSTLAGLAYTRERGVLLFAIFNTKGNVNSFRRLQDGMLVDLIVESGGAELSASLRRSSN